MGDEERSETTALEDAKYLLSVRGQKGSRCIEWDSALEALVGEHEEKLAAAEARIAELTAVPNEWELTAYRFKEKLKEAEAERDRARDLYRGLRQELAEESEALATLRAAAKALVEALPKCELPRHLPGNECSATSVGVLDDEGDVGRMAVCETHSLSQYVELQEHPYAAPLRALMKALAETETPMGDT